MVHRREEFTNKQTNKQTVYKMSFEEGTFLSSFLFAFWSGLLLSEGKSGSDACTLWSVSNKCDSGKNLCFLTNQEKCVNHMDKKVTLEELLYF